MKEYFDLGKYSRKVTTNELAQIWFNRGMVWLFAYNHEESILCFEKVMNIYDVTNDWTIRARLA